MKILIYIFLLGFISVIEAESLRYYFANDKISVSEMNSNWPDGLRTVNISLSRQDIVISQQAYRFPLGENDVYELPNIKESNFEMMLKLDMVMRDSNGRILEHLKNDIKLINPELENLLNLKIACYSARPKPENSFHKFCERFNHNKLYSLNSVDADLLLVNGLNLNLRPADYTKLYELSQKGVTVLILPPITGYIKIPHSDSLNLNIAHETILKDYLKDFPINEPQLSHKVSFKNRSGQPKLYFSADQVGWSWVEVNHTKGRLILSGVDLASLYSSPAPYLLMSQLIGKSDSE